MSMTDELPDALREALGHVIANERREWRRERELIEAQSREVIAGFRVLCVELDAKVERMVTDRLASLRNGKDGIDGPPGPEGPAGPSGMSGERGEPGERGADGAAGRDGVDGKDGAPGEPGCDGKDGERGTDGAAGRDGVDGKDGAPGEPGCDGKDGERGTDGAAGRDGVDGKDGLPGERGAEGSPGKLPVAKAWAEGVHYEGDVVTCRGGLYQAARDTGREPGHDDWLCLAAPGSDGRSPDMRGTFDASAEYRHLDIVALNGGSFVALKDDPGTCPGSGWQLLASAGKRGKDGAPGARGERGVQGDPGEPGAVIAGWKIDPDNYCATAVLTDGTQAEPLELRGLFEQFLVETRATT